MAVESTYRIILADDHILIRYGIKKIISQNDELCVVGEVSNGQELLDLMNTKETDLVILDISMPKISGIAAIELVKENYPATKILVLTMYNSKQHFYHAMGAGADGYLVKDDSDKELLIAIDRIRDGKMYVCPNLADDFTDDAISSYRKQKRSPYQELTKREKEILQLVVDGLTSRQIAGRLKLSPRTVDHHRASLLRKFNMKSSVDLVNYAVRYGLVNPEKY